jgi:uncharacterized protein YcsI (UPF0317 family)
MSNYKNALQEYCQKNKKPLPVYKVASEGEAHQLTWKVKKKKLIFTFLFPFSFFLSFSLLAHSNIAFNCFAGFCDN